MEEASDPVERETGGRPISWPWYVRWLAVAYVLSRFAGPVGFLVLCGVAGVLIARHGPRFDLAVVVTVAAAWACPAACAVFRWWFRRWGQRRWPDTGPS